MRMTMRGGGCHMWLTNMWQTTWQVQGRPWHSNDCTHSCHSRPSKGYSQSQPSIQKVGGAYYITCRYFFTLTGNTKYLFIEIFSLTGPGGQLKPNSKDLPLLNSNTLSTSTLLFHTRDSQTLLILETKLLLFTRVFQRSWFLKQNSSFTLVSLKRSWFFKQNS